jgi:transketolase
MPDLCWIYDSNRITIEGHTDLALSDDVATRFISFDPDTVVAAARQQLASTRAR